MRIDPPSEGWTAWAEATMRTGASVPRLPVRVAEAATRDPETENSGDGRDLESVDAFLEYCRTHALRGLRGGLPEAHRRTVDALWRVHATGGGSAGAAEEEVQVQVPEPEAPVMIAESGRPPASTRAHTSSSSPPRSCDSRGTTSCAETPGSTAAPPETWSRYLSRSTELWCPRAPATRG